MLNKKMVSFMKNFSYTLSSNLFSMIISALIIIIIPKLIGIEEYGYWQLYFFYSSYVGFLHFGWNDGIYLRYGGKNYRELDKELFFSQFWMLFISQVLIGALIISVSTIFNIDVNKVFILKMTILCMIIVNVRIMLIYILQGTNRIKEYAQITIIENFLVCLLVLVFLFAGVREYKFFIIADIIGKVIGLIYATYCCRDLVFNKISVFYFNIREIFFNVRVGIKLMFANIASMLIIGVVRFGIERSWDISTFGKVSLTLNISNLMMIFINAVGIVVFPILRRTNDDKLPGIYTMMRTSLMVPLLILLVVYYPLNATLSVWLPQYADSLIYMGLLFPICVYEGKMALLINTYLKTMRKEKILLTINLISMILSIIFTLLFTIAFKNLSLALLSIVILLAFRSTVAEVILSKILKVSVFKDLLFEMVMTVIFILTAWFNHSLNGIAIYLAAYVIYLVIKRKDIKITIINIKELIRR